MTRGTDRRAAIDLAFPVLNCRRLVTDQFSYVRSEEMELQSTLLEAPSDRFGVIGLAWPECRTA